MASGLRTVTASNTKFALVCKLLIEGGTLVLRDVFDAIHPPLDLKNHLMNRRNHHILKNLKSKKILRPEQWVKLYPTVGAPSSASFDITLLSLLLRNICSIPTPAKGWNDEPLPTSINQEDDIVRIKLYRNKLYGHICKPELTDAQFDQHWEDIRDVLVRLGGPRYKVTIDRLKIQSFEPEDQKYFIESIKQWAENEDKIMAKLETLEQNLGAKTDELKTMVEQVLPNMISPRRTSEEIYEDVEMYSTKLKEAILQRTEMQSKQVSFAQSTKTDDIFTNLTVHHGKQSHLQQRGRAQPDRQQGRTTLTEVKCCSDIFVDENEEDNPKSILVAGDPGIGKTLFSRNLARDWAKNDISIPNIKFTYLFTFRKLNLLGEEEFNFRELLNHSSLLNTTTMANEEIIDYIIEHPQQLLVVLDGLDEYKERHKITLDDPFYDDIKTKMPVYALISKLLHKKILSKSVTMVTSRVGEANELDKKINFDRYVQIEGFSESQVLEFVEKYFKSKPEEVRNLALKKVKETEHYKTFGRVPFMALLMCIVIEWEITSDSDSDNSDFLTITQFYFYVIESIEKKNRALSSLDDEHASSAVAKILDKFARLAAKLFEQDQYNFTIEDLKKLELPKDQIIHLTSSNLLCCIPVASNSPCPNTTLEYSFNHFSLQEFFVARNFVSEGKIPKHKISEMIFQFMSGLRNPEINEKLMLEVLESIPKHVEDVRSRQTLVSMRCLFEYRKDGGHVLTQVLTANTDNRYWDRYGTIELYDLLDSDYKPVVMVLNRLAELSGTLTEPPDRLDITDPSSVLSYSSLETLLLSLTNPQTTITQLGLRGCKIDDEQAKLISEYLTDTKITWLHMIDNNLTDKGAQYLIDHCDCQLAYLNLQANQVSNELEEYCSKNYPFKVEISFDRSD